MKLTQEKLKSAILYDSDTGLFLWISPQANKVNVGDVAGGEQHGYINIKIDSVPYKAHRLAWMYVHGFFPEGSIDHINGIKSDNRICNLRGVTHQENMRNMSKRRDNKTGVTGVYKRKDNGKYCASIRVNTKIKHLGSFSSLEDAVLSRLDAEHEFGFHHNHGRSS
tara:strand:- start:75 stop:572 length:498 start_codon:yes stop_codon:yes gene_type:complete